MRRILATLAFLALCAGRAGAQNVIIQSPYVTCLVTTNTATICHGDTAGITKVRNVLAVFNDSAAAQTATGTCYDNNTAASGTVVFNVPALSAWQFLTLPPPGKPVYNGFTCLFTAAPSGQVEFFVR